jgi:hypothetical protein
MVRDLPHLGGTSFFDPQPLPQSFPQPASSPHEPPEHFLPQKLKKSQDSLGQAGIVGQNCSHSITQQLFLTIFISQTTWQSDWPQEPQSREPPQRSMARAELAAEPATRKAAAIDNINVLILISPYQPCPANRARSSNISGNDLSQVATCFD